MCSTLYHFLRAVVFTSICCSTFMVAGENPVAVNFRSSGISAMAAGDNAGVVPQTHWNDVDLGVEGPLSGAAVFSSRVLQDSAGNASGITLSTTYTTGYTANNPVGVSADDKMMAGALYLKGTDVGAIQVSGILSEMQTKGYDVIVYFEATTRPRDISVTLGGVTIQGLDKSAFSGTFIQGTGAKVDSNYLKFSGLSAASFSMSVSTATSSLRAGVTGIQIVPVGYVESIPPVIESFTASPMLVASVTDTSELSWQVSGANSVSISPDVGTVAATGTTTVTPGGDQSYTLTAIGDGGTVTEAVSITLFDSDVPNIVIFITDDYGWQDTSYEFWDSQTQWNQLYRTPSMDRLADMGRSFTNAYASGPVCSCSRISIMLGQAPVRHGTTFITGNNGSDTNTVRSAVQDNGGIDTEERTRTLPKILSGKGYRSINVGKAHFGPADPRLVGFDRNRYGAEYGSPKGNGSNVYQQWVDGVQVHLSEALTLAAEEEVDAAVAAGEPFFLYLSHYAVHTPIIEDSRFSSNYPTVSGTTRAMATLVEGADKSLGDLIDYLEVKGIAEKTLIFYMSDHGGYSYRSGSSYYDDPPSPNRKFNWPLRGGKNDAYEGGLRIPFFVSWAKNDPTEPLQQALPIPAGTREDRPIIHADLLPTILKVTGHTSDIPSVVDGQDFSGYITGDLDFIRENKFFWHAPNFWEGSTAKPDSAMRSDNYKLVYTYDENEGTWELFDLDTDIGEQTNLMDVESEVGVRMARELITYLESENANYPTLVSNGQELPPMLPSQASVVDVDNDGLTDAIEDPNNNGLIDAGETNPDKADSDEDGTIDGVEIRINTDPLDPTSRFAPTIEFSEGGELTITWPSATGNVFDLLTSGDPFDWVALFTGIPASTEGNTTSRSLVPPDEPSFYRIELMP